MVQDNVTFQAESRVADRKSDLTNLRENGFIPAVVYSKGQEGTPVQLNEHAFGMMLKHHSGENLIIDLEIDSAKPKHVLIKEIQHHPLTSRILHVDFHEISLNRVIKVLVAIEFAGTADGVINGGGTLDIQTREVEVECKASELVESLEVDVTSLGIGDSLSVGDIPLPAGYTLLTPAEQSIATVLKPRVSADAGASEDGEAAEGGEPEVITAASDEEATDSDA